MHTSRKKLLTMLFSSAVIWSLIIVIFSFQQHRVNLQYGRPSTFFAQLNELYPWYASWFWFTPLIILAVRHFIHEKPSWWLFLAKHFVLLMLVFPLYCLSVGLIVYASKGVLAGSDEFFTGLLTMIKNGAWPYDLTIYITVILSAYVTIYIDQVRIKEKENLLLVNQLYRVKLDALKTQLNPHFLFNALNTISGLIRMNANQKATLALNELSYMLRNVLERGEDTVTLKAEITFIEKYIFFQTLRFERLLASKFRVDSDALEINIPFLLLHTLVENAVKHGAQEDGNTNNIEIMANISNNRLHIILRNDMAEAHHDNGLGIGLLNCQERLSLIYNDDFTLVCKKQNHNRYVTEIDLPLEIKDAKSFSG